MNGMNITNQVKVITGFNKTEFEKEVNEFLATMVVHNVKYDTAVKVHKGKEYVLYAAYITYLGKGEQSDD